MSSWTQDLRYAWRGLARDRRFTWVAVLTLALGIGANTAIFSMVNAVLFAPLPFPDPERLVVLWNKWDGYQLPRASLAVPEYLERSRENRTLEATAAYTLADAQMVSGDGPRQLSAAKVTPSLFDVLGMEPMLGRAFTADEARPGGGDVAMLSHGLWKRQFGGDPAIVGRTVRIDGAPRTIVGVMPRRFAFPNPDVEVWLPLAFTSEQTLPEARSIEFLNAVARLKRGVTIDQARADLDALTRSVLPALPSLFREQGFGSVVMPMSAEMSGRYRTSMLFLFGAVLFLLLIACVNIAHLMLARATTRRREIALRAALGASRTSIARQLLTESVLLAVCGGGAGLFLGIPASSFLAGLGIAGLPRLESFAIDWRVLGFTAGVTMAAGLLFGAVPLLQLRERALTDGLKSEDRGSAGGGRRTRDLLIACEAALTVMLLVGAGLMVKSLVQLRSVDPGFDSRGALAARTSLPAATYPDSARIVGFYERLLERLAAIPGVEAAGAITVLPLENGNSSTSFRREGAPASASGAREHAQVRWVAGDYFRAIGMRIVRGSGFATPRVAGAVPAVVNERLASAAFPGEEPIGQRLVIGQEVIVTVVGVAANDKATGLDEETAPMLYVPSALDPGPVLALVVRGGSDPRALAGPLRRTLASLDPELPLFDVATIEEVIAGSVAAPRSRMLVLALFAALALVLAAVGIYGVVAYTVHRRTREIGVRMALGAQPSQVIGVVMRQGLQPVMAGAVLGLAGAALLARLIQSQLYAVSPTDPGTYVAITAILMAVSAAACVIPASRAARVDPVTALRAE